MRSSISSILLAASCVLAIPTHANGRATVSSGQTAGFQNAKITSSSNGSAMCVTGNVAVYAATTKNLQLNLPSLDNQTVVTGIINDMLISGSTFSQTAIQGYASVSGTYSINCQICYPVGGSAKSSSIQFLTHGVGFDKSYWDVAAGYSYVDAAAASGYTTFSYDRLGVGSSFRPKDANAVVQAPLQLSIAHSLIQMLRNGTFGHTSYSQVIGVGHSFGSAVTQGVTNSYPEDLDAAVLTGFTMDSTGIPTFTTSLDLTIANENDAFRFAGVPDSYLVANNAIGNQFSFFKARGFPPSTLSIAEASKQTVTLGELISLSTIVKNATEFTGPIDVVNGSNDWPFCNGNCTYPINLSAQVKPALYPVASSSSTYYIAANTGHGLNLHYTAGLAYKQIQDFVKNNGF